MQCAGLTDELFKMMETQIKVTGNTCWVCRPCTAYSHGIIQRMREIEGKLENVEKKVEENTKEVKGLNKKVEKVEEAMRKKDNKVERTVRESEFRMCDEMREREARRRNIIFHSVGEDKREKASGKERQEWDRKSCYNIFSAMGVVLDGDAVRFCRRVGERKEEPLPLVCGFWEESDRNKVLRNARKLEGTDFKTVSVCPDLFLKQREEEADLRKEAERRNEEDLTEEDVTKNLRWAAVGDRGQKCLVRRQPENRGGKGRRMEGRRKAGGTWSSISEGRGSANDERSNKRRQVHETNKVGGKNTERGEGRPDGRGGGNRGGGGGRDGGGEGGGCGGGGGDGEEEEGEEPGQGGRSATGEALRLLYLNAQSIVKKIDELGCVLAEEKPDIILVTESWCNSNISDSFYLSTIMSCRRT